MPSVEVTQPTAQYTPDSAYALVQFSWRVAAAEAAPAGAWHRENYSPAQTQLSARAPVDVLAVVPGYWSDAEVREDVSAWITAQYDFTTVTFLTAGTS